MKSIFWTISLLAPRAEFGPVGHAAPNRIHWAVSWHGGTVASVCRTSETAKTLGAWMQTASCPP